MKLPESKVPPPMGTVTMPKLLVVAGFPGLPGEVTPEEKLALEPWPLFVEVGPGKVLKGLLRNIDKGLEVLNVEDPAGIAELKTRW